MSDLKFKASADLTQIRADLARLKTDLSALTTEIKINRTALQADITHAKSMITSQLTAVAHTVRVSVVADATKLAADIAAIRGAITTQLSSTITGVNHQLKFVVNIPLLNASLARAEAIIRAWIARIGATPISVSTGSFETTMRRAALLISGAVRALSAEIAALRGQITTLGGTSAASAAQIQTLQRQIDSLRSELDRMRNSAGTAQNSVGSLTSMIRSLAASIGGIAGLTMFMRITDEAKKFESQLRLVTASQQELIAVQTALFNLSNETGTAMESNVDLFSRIVNSSTSLNVTKDQILAITETIAKAGTIGGDAASSLNAALVQFGQGLSNNFSAAGQELNSIAEQARGLANVLAEGAGFSNISQLKKSAEKGEFTAVTALNAILKMQDRVNEKYAQINRTSDQSMQAFKNTFNAMLSAFDKEVGFSASVIKGIEDVRKNIEEVVYWIGLVGSAVGIKMFIAGIMAARNAIGLKIRTMIAERTETIAKTQADLAAARSAAVLAAQEVRLAQAEVQATLGTAAHAAATQRLTAARVADIVATRTMTEAQVAATAAQAAGMGVGRSLLAVLGGAGGLAITVLSVASAFLLMRDNSDEAESALSKLGDTALEAAQNFQKLSHAQQTQVLNKLKVDIRDTEKEVRSASLQMQSHLRKMLASEHYQANRQEIERVLNDLKSGVINAEQAFQKLDYQIRLNATDIDELSNAAQRFTENNDKMQQSIERAQTFKPIVDAQVKNVGRINEAQQSLIVENNNIQGSYKQLATVVQQVMRSTTDMSQKEQLSAALEKVRLGADGATDSLVKLLNSVSPQSVAQANSALGRIADARLAHTQKQIELDKLLAERNGEDGLGLVTQKTVAPKLDQIAIEKDLLEARIAADKEYTEASRQNIQRLGVLKLAELEKERQKTLGDAIKQGDVIRKIRAQQMETIQALADFDRERTQKQNDQAAALSDARTALAKEQINREMAALDAQHSADMISTTDLYKRKAELLERLHRLELSNMDARITRAKGHEREKLIIQRQTMLEAQRSAGDALNNQADQALRKLATDIKKAHEGVIDSLSKNTDVLAAEGMSELERQLSAVEKQFGEAQKKIDDLKEALAKGGVSAVNIQNDDGTMFTLTNDFIVSREAELQRQIEERKAQVRQEYAQKQIDESRLLTAQLAEIQGDALGAARIRSQVEFDRLIRDLKKKGDAAGIEVAVKIKLAQDEEQLKQEWQRRSQEIMNRMQSQQRSIDLAAATASPREMVGLNQARSQARADAIAALSDITSEMERMQSDGMQGLSDPLTELNNQIKELGNQAPTAAQKFKASMTSIAQAGANGAIDGLTEGIMGIVDGSKSASDAFKDMARSMVSAMAQIAARALATWATLQLLRLIPGGSTVIAAMDASANVRHTGGIAGGAGESRRVNPALFLAAPRYHVGGIAGLRPGEVPAILQAGEEVLTRNDPRHVANGGGGGGNAVRVVNVIDPNLVQDYMSSSSGEQTILNVMQRNAGTIKQILR